MADDHPKDLPTDELLKFADETIHRYQPGVAQVFFKWTCGSCGSRQMFDIPNKWFTSGKCEECGEVTELKEGGFLLSVTFPKSDQ